MFSTEAEQEVLVGAYGNSKAEADALFRNGFYKKAIISYTHALRHRPDSILCLVFRSRCHQLLGDMNKALLDAEAALAEDKTYYLSSGSPHHAGVYDQNLLQLFMKDGELAGLLAKYSEDEAITPETRNKTKQLESIFQKAEVLFNKGDFEMALVFYHRGNQQRPEFHNFRLGIRKAQEAIFNCVGTPDRVKLNTTGDLSFFAAHIEKKPKKKGALCTQTPQTVVRPKPPFEKRGNDKTIKQMLGDLYGDRKFLEKLLKTTDTQTATGRKVYNFANDGLTHLDKLAEFWQQVNPIYARTYERRLALNRGRAAKLSPHDYIYNQICKMENLMTEGNYEIALSRAKRILVLLGEYNETNLASKMQFESSLHCIMGNAYLEMNDLESAAYHHAMDLEIGEKCYIDHAELRALDNLGRVYSRMGEYQKAIDMWERKLPLSKGLQEIVWLCHELGKCYLELGDTNVAKEYGTRTLSVAEEIGNDKWKLHAYVLISQAQVKSGRLSSALINFEKAVELASLLKDKEARSAILTAIQDVNRRIMKREKAPSIWKLPELKLFSRTSDTIKSGGTTRERVNEEEEEEDEDAEQQTHDIPAEAERAEDIPFSDPGQRESTSNVSQRTDS